MGCSQGNTNNHNFTHWPIICLYIYLSIHLCIYPSSSLSISELISQLYLWLSILLCIYRLSLSFSPSLSLSFSLSLCTLSSSIIYPSIIPSLIYPAAIHQFSTLSIYQSIHPSVISCLPSVRSCTNPSSIDLSICESSSPPPPPPCTYPSPLPSLAGPCPSLDPSLHSWEPRGPRASTRTSALTLPHHQHPHPLQPPYHPHPSHGPSHAAMHLAAEEDESPRSIADATFMPYMRVPERFSAATDVVDGCTCTP